MSTGNIGRRDWMKLGSFGGVASLLAACQKPQKTTEKPLRGIVFLVSDGMSQGVLTMAENFSRLTRGKGTRWWELIDDAKAVSGLMETSSADSYVTDSAAASSAWGGGVKVKNGSINVRPDGSESIPIVRHLKKSGFRTGLVTTATVTHATPAGFAAVAKDRDDEEFIAPQYLGVVDFIMGGGRAFFDEKVRSDGNDLISRYSKAGYQIVQDRSSLLKTSSERILGLFSDDHMPYEIDRLHHSEWAEKVPSLSEMSERALSILLDRPEKFFLQIEGARVDHAAHRNDAAALLGDQLAFDDALAMVMEKVSGRDDILVIVTSDHGNSNPGLNASVQGQLPTNEVFKNLTRARSSYEMIFQAWNQTSEKSAANLGTLLAEKLGFTFTQTELDALFVMLENKPLFHWSKQLETLDGVFGQMVGNHTGIGWTGRSHTSDPTIVTSIGPQAQRFSGITQNFEMYQHFLDLLS